MAMSMPALIARAMASFLSWATYSRFHRLSMSAQSVTITPSQFSSCFSQRVRYRALAWKGTPLLVVLLTITDSAPPSWIALRYGSKCFSRISISPIELWVRSRPLTGEP